MKRKFFDTWVSRFAGLESQQTRVLKYVLENQQTILDTSEVLALVQPIRTILKTPMAELFNRLVSSEQLSNFAAFYDLGQSSSLPELLTSSNITLDLGQFKDASSVLMNTPKLKNKTLVNLTSVLRRNRSTGELSVNAIDNFQNLFVRGQLVMAYTDLDDWITAPMQEFVIRSYSMVLSAMISRYYSLTMTEQATVALHFALYMAQMLTPGAFETAEPPIFFRCTTLGKLPQLKEVVDMCRDKSSEGLTLASVCQLIAEHGPSKMHAFDLTALSALCDNLGPDLLTTRLALEYPPYWVYCLLLAFSGSAKIPLIYQLNNQRLMNEGRSKFLTLMFSSPAFYLDQPLR